VLYCVRGDTAAATTYATLDDILCSLTAECITVLFQKRFVTSVDLSFRANGEPDQVVLTSVLHKSDSGLQLKYDQQLMRGVDHDASRALAQVAGAIDKSVRSVTLEAGDTLVLDNRTVVHGRSAFSPRYDGTDRWLKRALVVRNLPPETKGHVIDIASIGTVVPEPANAHRYKDTSSRMLQAVHRQSTGAV
jgi:L-asparagine oxygenase